MHLPLRNRDFTDAFDMATAFKIRLKKLIHYGTCRGFVNVTPRHDEHIGVIVQARHLCKIGSPTEGGADLLVLIERHADALA